AVIVEGGNALRRGHKIRRTVLRHLLDESYDGFPGRGVVPRWERIGGQRRCDGRQCYASSSEVKLERCRFHECSCGFRWRVFRPGRVIGQLLYYLPVSVPLVAPGAPVPVSLFAFVCIRSSPNSLMRFCIFNSLSVSSRIVAGLKLGGTERGGNSLNVSANANTSAI